MHKCTFCDYQSTRSYNLKVHVKNKHNSQTGSGVEQSIQPHSQNEMNSNLQEENIEVGRKWVFWDTGSRELAPSTKIKYKIIDATDKFKKPKVKKKKLN